MTGSRPEEEEEDDLDLETPVDDVDEVPDFEISISLDVLSSKHMLNNIIHNMGIKLPNISYIPINA